MEQRFNIYYSGQIAKQHDPAVVRQNIGKIFKADDAILDKLFSGELQLLKKNCDAETARKYEHAMARAGAVAIVRPLDPPAAEAPTGTSTPAQETAATEPAQKLTMAERVAALTAQAGDAGLQGTEEEQAAAFEDWASPNDSGDKLRVTPKGTEVLREEERTPAAEVSIDTSALQLDEHAERLSAASPPPPPAPDTSHLQVGPAGETIPNLPTAELLLEPDISALDLAPQGTGFEDCSTQIAAPVDVDVSAIVLAPEGSELLEAQYRKGAPPPPPATDHISVED